MAELRWILSGLGAVLIAAIWWWSTRRAGQATGIAELRESSVVPPPEIHDPLEPLSIRTAEFVRVPHLEAEPPAEVAAGAPAGTEAAAVRPAPQPAPAESTSANTSERQKIVALRVCAVGEPGWRGSDLISALESQGLVYGRYQVYHRRHADGRSIFCVASLVEPGTFDAARMAEEDHRGVSLFAVLPGPLEPLQAIDALLATARDLARHLSGTVQDAKGIPFSPQRVAALREDIARFQSAS